MTKTAKPRAIDVLRAKVGGEYEAAGGDEYEVDSQDLALALVELSDTLDEVFLRVKKTNSLAGMLIGRFPAKRAGS